MSSLIRLLSDTEALLRSVGETFWADKLVAALRRPEGDDAVFAPEQILAWYGGMGSFNDLVISARNGHTVAAGEEAEAEVNVQLNDLRERIYQEAVRQQSAFQ